ncbi:ammonia monooxygenase [Streptomyces bathyalis]|uniref:Ammonia monooxygenase n=1 Tax=Streptomyces bathyalis TaxID=2710756 RepID=A0A7T1T6X0_9ACTN|nr:AbrB family transcriptional regulator [Streptomyces bathyalis]QPP07499.1 ammonia monooxygenase [Streptomyces bathyalis]
MSEPSPSFSRAAVGLLAGAAGGLLLTWLRVPAGTLVGAVLGSAAAGGFVNARRHPVQRWVRTAGLVLIGCVSAARLDGESLAMMGRIALPVLAAVVLLLVLNAVLARWLILRHGLDPTTAVLACAPGGLSELAVLAVKERADVPTVTVIHLVRVLLVVLVALPALVLVLGRSA